MAVEFGASIKLDSNSALQQMRKFGAATTEASKTLKLLQAEVKSTQEGLNGNIFRKYITASRTVSTQTEKSIARLHDQRKALSKLTDAERSLVTMTDKLNQKYDDSARAEAKLIQVRKELRLITAAGLKTQKESDAIYAREAKRIHEGTTAYRARQTEIAKTNNLRKAEAQNIHNLRMKYDKAYAIKVKEKKVLKDLNILLKQGKITLKQYNQILRKQKVEIEHVTSRFQRMAGAQSLMSKTARLVSIYSRVFLGLYAAARIGKFATDVERTAQNIQLLADKLEFITGDSGAYRKLFDMTQEVGLEMQAANKIITRFAVVTNRAFSIDTMNQWAATIVKSARATGTSTQEMSGALIQITQAMSAGRLMGDEYRSVTENLPLLTVALRDMFSKSTLSLKELSSQGLLTTEVLVEAFDRLKLIIADFPDTTDTVDAAIGRLSSSWDNLMAAIGDTGAIRGTLNTISEWINSLSLQTEEAKEIYAKNRKSELTQRMIDAKAGIEIKKNEIEEINRIIAQRSEDTPQFLKSIDNKKLENAQKDLREYVDILAAVRENMEGIAISQAEIDKINRDKQIQAERELSRIFSEQLKTQNLIEKIEKGKGIESVKKKSDLIRKEVEGKEKLFADGEAGGLDPDNAKRLYELIDQNERDGIEKVIKTRINLALRMQGFKTKFNTEDIKKELAHNSKILEITEEFAKNKLIIQSAAQARVLGIEQGQDPEFMSTVTAAEADRLIKSLEAKKLKEIDEEIAKVTNRIELMGNQAKITTATIERDRLGLLSMKKDKVFDDFNKSIIELKKELKKLSGQGIDTNAIFEEQFKVFIKLRDLKLFEADRKLNESLQDKFSQQKVSLREYERALIDLKIAKDRVIVNDEEHLRNMRLINLEYDTQTASVRALTGELAGLDQIYVGLEHGARNFMENTSTMYDFFRTNTEDLFDSSVGLIIDHSRSAQEAFKALVKSMSFELQKLIIKRAILQAFGGFNIGWLGGGNSTSTNLGSTGIEGGSQAFNTFDINSAKGNVFSGKGISAFSGSVVSRPTLFPFANGVGLMGEGGSPEAILPLKRGSDGKLGVQTASSGTPVVINNYSNSNIRTETTRDVNGKKMIRVIVDEAISSMVQNGRFDSIMSPYNIRRNGSR